MPDHVVLADPGGNITALVFDEVDPADFKQINGLILHKAPIVEQVLFVQKKDGIPHGQMAGGEFCGNAARALGFVLAKGRQSQQSFSMSGTKKPVTVEVAEGCAKLILEMHIRQSSAQLDGTTVPIVHLEGISHAVFLSSHPAYAQVRTSINLSDRERFVINTLKILGLSDCPASGLIFLDCSGDSCKLLPYVYVKAVETVYAETACASGSIAAAILIGNELAIKQPSGETLRVSIQSGRHSTHAKVAGRMSVIWTGAITGQTALITPENINAAHVLVT